MNNNEIKEKLLSNVYKLCEKRGRSKLWECFRTIKDENDIDMVDFVACKICIKVYKYNKNSLSNLNKHKCYAALQNEKENDLIEPNQETKKACTDKLTEWVLRDLRPYSLVKDKGLKDYSKLMLCLGNKFGSNLNIETLIPHPTTIYRNVENTYDIHFAKLKIEMSSIRKIGYALTCDLWTENFSKISYLALTAHFVMDGECKSKLLGVKSMKGMSNTSINIKVKLETLLSEFNCSLNDLTVVVTDRGSNIKAALKEHENINCISHLLHNTVEKCIKESLQIDEIVTTSSKLVKFFKKSGLNCDLNTSLKSFTPTRWNTVYFNLLSIKSNFADIQKIISEKNLTDKYSVIKEYHLDYLIAILKPFMEASKELEGSSYATIHLVHPHIQNLKTICNTANNDEPSFILEFRQILHDTLISLVDSKITIYHKLSIFLFPPANQLTQFSIEEQTEVIIKCKSLMLPYLDDINITPQPIGPNTSRIYSLFEKYVQPIVEDNSNQSVIDNEIIKYKNTSVNLQNDFNILKWWNDRQNEFPLLYKLSCRIFSIPASSAPSERIFSIARALITDKRSQLGSNGKSFNEILFVNINSKD